MNPFSDALVDLCDRIVYEQNYVYPEDMFFVLLLLEKYYKGLSRDEDYTQICNIAWEIATFTTDFVESNHNFHWINAYSVLSQNYNRKLREMTTHAIEFECPSYSHYSTPEQTVDLHESAKTLSETINDITEIIQLYRNGLSEDASTEEMDEINDTEAIPNKREISLHLHTLSKRYASGFEYDIIESAYGMELINTVIIKHEKDDSVSNKEVCKALDLIVEWTNQKAKREYSVIS